VAKAAVAMAEADLTAKERLAAVGAVPAAERALVTAKAVLPGKDANATESVRAARRKVEAARAVLAARNLLASEEVKTLNAAQAQGAILRMARDAVDTAEAELNAKIKQGEKDLLQAEELIRSAADELARAKAVLATMKMPAGSILVPSTIEEDVWAAKDALLEAKQGLAAANSGLTKAAQHFVSVLDANAWVQVGANLRDHYAKFAELHGELKPLEALHPIKLPAPKVLNSKLDPAYEPKPDIMLKPSEERRPAQPGIKSPSQPAELDLDDLLSAIGGNKPT
jgi:hypothetical protein